MHNFIIIQYCHGNANFLISKIKTILGVNHCCKDIFNMYIFIVITYFFPVSKQLIHFLGCQTEIKMKIAMSWRHCSRVKSLNFSCKGPECNSQHPFQVPHKCVQLQLQVLNSESSGENQTLLILKCSRQNLVFYNLYMYVYIRTNAHIPYVCMYINIYKNEDSY